MTDAQPKIPPAPPGDGKSASQTSDQAELMMRSEQNFADLPRAEQHYKSLSHIDDICLLPAPHADGAVPGLFAVVVPNAAELTARKVASARERIGELLEISGCVLPVSLRVANFTLADQPLPRDREGKLCREEVALRYAPGGRDGGAAAAVGGAIHDSIAASDNPAGQRFVERLREILGVSGPIATHQNLETDLGMDSLAQMQIRIVLEDELGVRIDDGELWRIQTVGDFLDRIKKVPNEAPQRAPDSFWCDELRRPVDAANNFFDRPASLFGRAFFRLLQIFIRLVLRIFYRASISGLEKIPASGPLLICPNHLSYLDSPIIHCLLPRQFISRTYFMGYREIFREPPLTWMVRACRLILTGDAESVLDSLRLCYQALRRGKAVCIFPEGIRSTTGTLMRARPGIGMLACEAQAPIVPILIEGSEATMSPPNPGFHLCRIRVVVGDPIPPPEPETFTVADYQALADRWREAVLRLRNDLQS